MAFDWERLYMSIVTSKHLIVTGKYRLGLRSMDSQVIQSKDKTATITSFSIETLISNLKMNFSFIVLILLRYSIHLACTGLISEKMKVSTTQHDVRPVGVWSGPPKRRSEMTGRASWDTFGAKIFFVKKPLIMDKALRNSLRLENTIKAEDCPPGMWACKKKMIISKQMLRKAVKRSKQSKRQVVKRDTNRACPLGVWSCSAQKQVKIRTRRGIMDKALKDSFRLQNLGKAEDCPPGMWACKKMIISKQMLRTAVKRSKQSKRHVTKRDTKRACPPGVWSCSAKKQSKIRRAAGSYPPIWTR